jgi:RecA/RadA recombinase
MTIEKLKRAKEKAKALEAMRPPKLLRWYAEGDWRDLSRSWLVEEMIPQSSVGLIVGESGAGKTFLALELAVAISEGRDFFGKSAKKGSVFFIAAEGEYTIPSRLHAARRGNMPKGNKVYWVDFRERLGDPEVLDKLIKQTKIINEQLVASGCDPISLILIDTMIAAFPVDNWNDASQVSEVYDMMRHLQKELNVGVVGIHHHGKNKDKGAAGSHYLRGGADFMLEVFRDDRDHADPRRRFKLSKNRFGREGDEWYFRLAGLLPDLYNEYDDCGYSLVYVEQCDSDESAGPNGEKKKLSPADRAFESAFKTVASTTGERGPLDEYVKWIRVLESAVKAKFEELYKPNGKNPKDAMRAAWKRALNGCTDKFGINRDDGWLYQDTVGDNLDQATDQGFVDE